MTIKEQLKESITAKGLSYSTYKSYWNHIERFCYWLRDTNGGEWIHPENVGRDEVEQYLSHLANFQFVAPKTQNSALSALCYLYRWIIKKPLVGVDAIRSKPTHNVPAIPDVTQVKRLFDHLHGPALLACQLMYGCGLRIGETMRLRVKDLNFERRQLEIHHSKNNKSRLTPFPEILHEGVRHQLETTRRLYEWDLKHNPNGVSLPNAWRRKSKRSATEFAWYYLFCSESLCEFEGNPECRHHRHQSHLSRSIAEARRAAGIHKRITAHDLRRAYATHSNEQGVDITVLQQLLGHSNIETTMIYVRCNKDRVTASRSPIETLDQVQAEPTKPQLRYYA